MATTADALLERLASAPDLAGLFLDFDGVLSPIVARPEDAAAPAESRSELARLAARYRVVCVVSGRPSEDVRARVGVDGVVVVGTHGLELDPAAEEWRAQVEAFAATVSWPAPDVELKGLTVAFHFRSRDDEDAAVAELESVAAHARKAGLVARFGRKVLEVLPPIDANKGTAVRLLLDREGLARALVAGDDTTDLDAFRAVDGCELAVRVAVASAESPAELRASADVVVESTDAFLELLRRL